MTMNEKTEFIKFANTPVKQINIERDERVFLFDIDETLYEYNEQSRNMRRNAIFKYLQTQGINDKDLSPLLDTWSLKYGITLKGVSHSFELSHAKYDELCTPNLEAIELLSADEELLTMIKKINGRKFCFTNAEERYARPVLEKIKLTECFEAVFCCDYSDIDFMCKPNEGAYKAVENILGNPDVKNLYFFDDRPNNIEMAVKRGWNGFLIEKDKGLKEVLRSLHKN